MISKEDILLLASKRLGYPVNRLKIELKSYNNKFSTWDHDGVPMFGDRCDFKIFIPKKERLFFVLNATHNTGSLDQAIGHTILFNMDLPNTPYDETCFAGYVEDIVLDQYEMGGWCYDCVSILYTSYIEVDHGEIMDIPQYVRRKGLGYQELNMLCDGFTVGRSALYYEITVN